MKKINELVKHIGQLAVDVQMSGEAIVFFRVSGHVNTLDVEICDKENYKKRLYEAKNIAYDADYFVLDRERYENEVVAKLSEIKAELETYLYPNEFQSIWNSYQSEIEAEIIDCIRKGCSYTDESLFHDVMIETSGHEISLDCVYQSMKLYKGESYAKKFKQEMYDLIAWLDKNVHANYSEYESEVV